VYERTQYTQPSNVAEFQSSPQEHLMSTVTSTLSATSTPAVHGPLSARLLHKLHAPLVSGLRHPWVESIVRLSAVEDTLRGLHPLLSLTTVRARVLRIVDETPSTKTFVLQPNALWMGARAGQFVQVSLEIAGRRVQRAYSLSSRPGARRIAITVKRQDGGLVSNHLHTAINPGDVLTLSQALGDFVLPEALPAKLLLLSAGSGITPVMAMLRDLHRRGYAGDVHFVHVCHSPQELIFAQQLRDMAWGLSGRSRLAAHCSARRSGALRPKHLQALVPDLAQRATWMCGPEAFMATMEAHWHSAALTAPLAQRTLRRRPIARQH
jgi:ferredoxin-NADP reductase